MGSRLRDEYYHHASSARSSKSAFVRNLCCSLKVRLEFTCGALSSLEERERVLRSTAHVPVKGLKLGDLERGEEKKGRIP